MKRVKNLYRSFGYAFSGFAYCLQTQRNVRIHLAATIVVVILAVWLDLSTVEWALIFLAFGLVWMAELSNTALEAVVDLLSPQYHDRAKVAKDVQAAAVLSGVLAAVMVGVMVLIPVLLKKLGY